MTVRKTVKAQRRHRCRLVGVITTPAELQLAARMPRPPDLFEVRLDQLTVIENELERKMSILPRPLIITARHQREGGANALSRP